MMRAFVSVDITDDLIGDAIMRVQRNSGLGGAIRRESMHFTLMFLGKVDTSKTADIVRALKDVDFEAFDIQCRGLGEFTFSKGKIIWVGVDRHGGMMLKELASKVAKTLMPLGFVDRKRFLPHATIFRVKNKTGDTANVLKRFENIEFGIQRVNSIRLKSSVLSSSGSTYKDIVTIGAKR
ncbi:MAG: 2'-5' RNA ligase [Cenarchaeum symbiont of Oopsacas minuta]|nr:2'-5' RNA ligase [Cenarchaeum symbiont of Oopsacas minuta]